MQQVGGSNHPKPLEKQLDVEKKRTTVETNGSTDSTPRAQAPHPSFHLLKTTFDFPLLVLNGIYHYCNYMFSRGLNQMEAKRFFFFFLVRPKATMDIIPANASEWRAIMDPLFQSMDRRLQAEATGVLAKDFFLRAGVRGWESAPTLANGLGSLFSLFFYVDVTECSSSCFFLVESFGARLVSYRGGSTKATSKQVSRPMAPPENDSS